MASKRIKIQGLPCADKNGAGNEIDLDSASSSAAWFSSSVMWHRRHVVDPTNTETCSCECPNGSLGAGTRNPGAHAADSPYPDVKCIDTLSLGGVSSCDSRLHSC